VAAALGTSDLQLRQLLTRQLPAWLDHATGPLIRIVLVVLIGAVARFLLHRLIDRLAEQVATGRGGLAAFDRLPPASAILSNGPLSAARREQRARAIGSVLKSITTGLVAGLVVLMVVQEFYDIAPLLAGAGILGITLGLGAQSLVRDFLAGIFMIVEDQYGVGDVIETAGTVGTVESVGLRVTRVRDDDGATWYLRNGEIQRLGNRSQGWGRAVVAVDIRYGQDLDRVQQLMMDCARQLAAEPELRPALAGDPTFSGVTELGPAAVRLQVEVRTRAGRDATVARTLRRRIVERLAGEGVRMGEPDRA
jgi:moderate conductance mechanosensitive channel